MKRRFVIAASLDASAEMKLSKFLGERGTWWHWIPSFWLFMTEEGDLTCTAIRNHVNEIDKDADNFIMEVKDDGVWSGYGPNKTSNNMFRWLENYWSAGQDVKKDG